MKKQAMKNILICLVVGVMVFTSACSKKADAPAAESTATEENTDATATEATTEAVAESETETPATEQTTEGITSFDDVNTDKVSLIALGNADVPVGQYSQEIFETLGFWNNIQSKISFGTNVKEVLSQVEEGAVDCGVVYATDAKTSDGVTVVCTAPESSLKTPVLYPVAALNKSPNADAAKVFLNYLLTDKALTEFKNVGFTIATDKTATDMTYEGQACTLNVFAAASLTESLTAIQKSFQEEYPAITLVFNFDSSGTLQTQIEEGAEADIFFSAAEKQMTALNDGGFIAADTIVDILKNEVVLITPKE